MRLSPLLVLAGGLFALPATSHAWGDEGHQLVVELAMQFRPELRPRIAGVLAQMPRSRQLILLQQVGVKEHPYYRGDRARWLRSLATNPALGGTFPDWIKDYEESGRYGGDHYINYWFDPNQGSVPLKPVNGVTKLREHLAALRQPDPGARAWALGWTLHLVGDLHQPLHCATRMDLTQADGHDGGGNFGEFAQYDDRRSLHQFWDGLPGRLRRRDESLPAMAKRLRTSFLATPAARTQFAHDRAILDPDKWAHEGLRIIRTVGYPKDHPAMNYERAAKEKTYYRLLLAGARLADLLHRSL